MGLGYPLGNVVESVKRLLAFSEFRFVRLGQRLRSISSRFSGHAAEDGT